MLATALGWDFPETQGAIGPQIPLNWYPALTGSSEQPDLRSDSLPIPLLLFLHKILFKLLCS